MKKGSIIRKLRKLHKWPGIIISLFVVLFAFSGIIMNHRGLVSPLSVSRKLLPSNFHYKNWNLAAVRGSIDANGNSYLYGNIGIWKTKDDFQSYSDFNTGFPKGIDNRKIYAIVPFLQNKLVAGTQMGLYQSPIEDCQWEKIEIPVKKNRIADMTTKGDTLIVLTRHYMLKTIDLVHFEKVQLPPPTHYQREIGLFKTLWELHSGELFGFIGKLLVDLFGVVVIILSITGLLHFIFPKIIRRKRAKELDVKGLTSTKRKNLKWHNVIGYVFVLFLIINTISGMHLRPPLLIAIANTQVGIIPYTHLDSPNPWFDKLRRVKWNEKDKIYIFSTSEGFYYANEELNDPLQSFANQPPVSVMGCNVFEEITPDQYLVGSFSGLYVWDKKNSYSYEFFNGKPYQKPAGMTKPIAANMVAGWVTPRSSHPFWFDYNQGATAIMGNEDFVSMPKEILKKSPMSLWNVSLEIHTGRIFEHLLGPFYILYVPLAGICILVVLISGFFIWWIGYRKKK